MTEPADISVGSLFERPFRAQWGTRGDVHLWEALREHFGDAPLPDFFLDLRLVLHDGFAKITGHDIEEHAPFYLSKFDPGHGMSAGVVSPDWWRMTAVPVLIDRAWATGAYDGR